MPGLSSSDPSLGGIEWQASVDKEILGLMVGANSTFRVGVR
jgi:hypothetical protein